METYISTIIPGVHRLGHTLAFWSELNQPADREPVPLPDGAPAWCVSEVGVQAALAALREWHPDLIYSHGLFDPKLEARTLGIAPAVFCALAYYGTCISGAKTFKFPVVTPCSRRFGWQCLIHYYPHRCGGWSPVTMVREYRRQSKRLDLLRRYKAIVTLSDHMAAEYIKHGYPSERIHTLVPPLGNGSSHRLSEILEAGASSEAGAASIQIDNSLRLDRSRPYWRLLFLGRMDFWKGGHLFLDALPRVAASLDRPLRVTFAGDGPERSAWESQAKRLKDQAQGLEIEFVGWLEGRQREALIADSDLLVMPSQWPEPFGLSGLEAGLHGIPAVAFAVGGIPEWLQDGVNGFLAPGNPPTAAGLSEAIVRALHDPDTHARLRRGALEKAKAHTLQEHIAQLLPVLERYAR
ncbi:MAG TPA: glycosyltransferase family 4 protein [Terriglobales bacterium]|nr:glycosyltransferase family 4 protein [Terriglobales bacterium]